MYIKIEYLVEDEFVRVNHLTGMVSCYGKLKQNDENLAALA